MKRTHVEHIRSEAAIVIVPGRPEVRRAEDTAVIAGDQSVARPLKRVKVDVDKNIAPGRDLRGAVKPSVGRGVRPRR
jgi:hypothetical protein